MSKKINDLFFMRPWAVKEDVFNKMREIVERHIRGEKLSKEEIEAQIGSEKKGKPDYEVINGAAVIPIYGVIAKRVSQVRGISQPQGTAIEEIRRDLMAAIEDSSVEKIILDIDSPGGSVDGVAEFSDFIFSMRGKKPILAYADGQMASAAYWIGSAAEKIFASKSSELGSIGVYAVISDWTVANHNEGIKTEVIKAGKYKAAGHPDKPFTEDDRQVIQEEINTYYDLFTEAIMRNRGMSSEEVKEVATGRVFIGKKALEVGLMDGITSLAEMIGPAGGKEVAKSSVRAETIGTQDKETNITKKEGQVMEITVEKLKTDNKAVADALIAEGKEIGLKEGKEAGLKEGRDAGIIEGKKAGATEAQAAEKVRVEGILGAAPKGMEAVALQCIKEGKSIEASKDVFLHALKTATPAGPGPDADPDAPQGNANETIEDKCKREWESNPQLAQEWLNLEAYTGFKRAEAKGRIRVVKK